MDAIEAHPDVASRSLEDQSRSGDLSSFVHLAYEVVLGRSPETESIVALHASSGSPEVILSSIARSDEAAERRASREIARSPFHHYASLFDAEEIIRRHARRDLAPDPRWLTNFLGVRIEEDYMPAVLSGKAGTIEGVPIPANWHADIAEWAGVLRAVELADRTFSVVELGCGWACWLNNAGVAARSLGLRPSLIGVEGDEGHIAFARRCCALNGFTSEQVTLHRGVAAAFGGTALFPRQGIAGQKWGLEPIFGATGEQRREAAENGHYDVLPMLTLDEVIGKLSIIDLLHVDIQGGEADLVEKGRGCLDGRVAYMLIGTHSRYIEGRINAALAGGPWRLEIERPAIVQLLPDGPLTVVDGVQGWRNTAVRPD